MALPATSTSPGTPSHPHSQQNWLAEHTQPTHRNTHPGQKRRADEVEDLEDRSNNISSNFKKLRINSNILPARPHTNAHADSHASITSHPAYHPPSVQSVEEPYIHHPQPSLHPYSHRPHAPQNHLHPHHAHLSPNRDFTHTPPPAPYLHPPSRTSTATTLSDEPMTLDIDHDQPPDPNRIIINDLSAELEEIEAAERLQRERDQEQAFFLLDDIEDKISGVPAHLLRNSQSNHNSSGAAAPDSQALILYKLPSSISVPEEEDAVKKALLETRRRMRERQKEPPPPSPFTETHTDMHDTDTDHPDQAEPYIRHGLTNDVPVDQPNPRNGVISSDFSRRADRDTARNGGRFSREQTPFPFPNPNVRQPIMSAPYVPVDIDYDVDGMDGDDDIHARHDTNLHARHGENGGFSRSWDDDVMDIE